MANKNQILEMASVHVMRFLNERLPSWAVYHNLQHTLETVAAVWEIGLGSKLSPVDMEIVTVSAWFHDTGYVFTSTGHEETSVEIATGFLQQHRYPRSKLNDVARCIMATKLSQVPASLIEQVIRDADMIFLGKEEFFEKNTLLKQEVEQRDDVQIDERAWMQRTVDFIKSQHFYTTYAQSVLTEQYRANVMESQRRFEATKGDSTIDQTILQSKRRSV